MYIQKGDLFHTKEPVEAIEIFNPFGGHSMGFHAPSIWFEKNYNKELLGTKRIAIKSDDLLVASEGYASIGGWSVTGLMPDTTKIHFLQYRAVSATLRDNFWPEDSGHFLELSVSISGYGQKMLKDFRIKVKKEIHSMKRKVKYSDKNMSILLRPALKDIEKKFYMPCIYASQDNTLYYVNSGILEEAKRILDSDKNLSKKTLKDFFAKLERFMQNLC